jgi:hypothetical protein
MNSLTARPSEALPDEDLHIEKREGSRDDIENILDQPPLTENEGPDPNVFPDGGWEAWLVVAGGFCIGFSSFGWINCKRSGSKYCSELC